MSDEVEITYGGLREMLPSLAAVTVCVLIGGGSLYGGIVADRGGRVPAMIVGGVFLALGIAMTFGLVIPGRRKHLAFDRDGIHGSGPGDRRWELRWDEINRVRVELSVIKTRRAAVHTVRVMIAVRELQHFAEHHPEISALRGGRGAAVDEVNLPIGHVRRVVPDILAALDRYAGAANGGLIDLT